MMADKDDTNKKHSDITDSTFMHPYISNVEEMIDFGLYSLGHPLITVELTRKQIEFCLMQVMQIYTKYASFPIEDIIVDLSDYEHGKGIDLSKYNITRIEDISFQRDTLLHGFGNDMFFGTGALIQSYAGAGVFPYFNSVGSPVGSWVGLHNLREHLETINRLTGSVPQYRYFNKQKRLVITPEPRIPNDKSRKNLCLITCEVEPPPEELYGNEYLQRMFVAKLKIMLGIVRKKFSSVQLIGGGTIDTSIGDEGQQEWEKVMEDLSKNESFPSLCYIG